MKIRDKLSRRNRDKGVANLALFAHLTGGLLGKIPRVDGEVGRVGRLFECSDGSIDSASLRQSSCARRLRRIRKE